MLSYFWLSTPFQDGNGWLSRILATLLLLRAGYSYVPYASLESVVEGNKGLYYKALQTACRCSSMHRLAIADPTDPQRAMVGLAWAATQAADLARTAPDQVDNAVRGIPERIYAGANKAGDNLSSALGNEVRDRGVEMGQAITLAITEAASTGAASIKQATDDLPRLASQQQAQIVLEWQAAPADAARTDQARIARPSVDALRRRRLGPVERTPHVLGHSPFRRFAGAPNCGVLRARDGRAYDVCLTK